MEHATPPPKLPSKLTLPSGAVVFLEERPATTASRGRARQRAPLFDDALIALSEGSVVLTREGVRVDAKTLALRDFHVIRAVLARSGVISENEVEIRCRNCGALVRVRPCAALEVGPWVHGELGDPELDETLPFGEPIPVTPPIPLGRVRAATTVTFVDRTVRDAQTLFVRAAASRLDVDEELVRAMGIAALGPERDPASIAAALAACDDDAFGDVTDAFLGAHYVPRLGAVVICHACRARNDVDAPYEREFGGMSARGPAAESPTAATVGFPTYDAFADRALAIARPFLDDAPCAPSANGTSDVELVIEGGTPAVDDGGEPLLGSYRPPSAGDATTPSEAPVVTVYYRTFRAIWDDEGAYDWEDELAETLEHEFEHHLFFLRGDDPMDDEERAAIRDEAIRIVGRREVGRRELAGFASSLSDFAARTWPVWLLALVALAFMLVAQR